PRCVCAGSRGHNIRTGLPRCQRRAVGLESGHMATAASPGFFRSSIGKKVVMAASGAVLFGFVLGHMLGNLQVYLGPAALNGYAEKLRHLGPLLWAVRAVLLAAVTLHIASAYSLTRMSQAARPVGYRERENRESTYASRTMRWGGVILLLFIV